MNRSPRLISVLAALLAAGSTVFGQPAPAASELAGPPSTPVVTIPQGSPKLTEIQVDVVKAEEVSRDELVAPGKVEAIPTRVSRIALPVTGRIASLLVTLGDEVQANQPLLTIVSPDAQNAVSMFLQAEASLAQSRSAMVKAKSDFDRASDLFAHKAVAEKEVINARSSHEQATAQVKSSKASLELAQGRLEFLGLKAHGFDQTVVVRAPYAGKVSDINVAKGDFRSDTGAPVLTVADLSHVWITCMVPEVSFRHIMGGESLEVTLNSYPDEVFKGTVARIGDKVDPQTRTISVIAELENPHGRFRPEMFGRIHLAQGVRPVPVAPVGAVIQGIGRDDVFVEKSPGVFEMRRVTLGPSGHGRYPVTSGLVAGERLVIGGTMLLKGEMGGRPGR
ncbi:MAG: efflux RND transporter periplasmic adaptor subunit [Candidatus Wallbacteria bacterium]|nr:efflux RND transporter periplasmic adaptor subunit [Candidatus Wallbacteria bacterium]